MSQLDDIRAEPPQVVREKAYRVDLVNDLATLARAAIALHDSTKHYGECDVCKLVERYRLRLRGSVDVFGLRGGS